MIDTARNEFERLVKDRSHQSFLRIYVIGDFGSGDAPQAKVAEAMAYVAAKEPPDFILSTGDSVYPLDAAGNTCETSPASVLAERFDTYYRGLGVDFFQCVGNEELLNVFASDATPMVAHTWRSPVWRMPAPSYGIPRLPPWIGIHVTNTNVFGFGGIVAELTMFSEALMAREIDTLRKTFAKAAGLRVLVGHHPIFTPGKRTLRYNGDGELLYMRCLRRAIEETGVHFYFSGHEHHQSHMTGLGCEHITQGCGGARLSPNPNHPRREGGWRDAEKILRHLEVMGGFAVLEADAAYRVRLRFFGLGAEEPARAIRVIYECSWQGLDEIGATFKPR